MEEKKIKISVNEEDVQNLINCYEKDIEYIKKLEKENEILKIEIRDLKEQLKDEDTYHEEANKWCIEAHELAIENKELKERIDKTIEYIKHSNWLRQDQIYDNSCDMQVWEVKELLKILRGEENVKN